MKEKVFLLMFDAQMTTKDDRRRYGTFITDIKAEGFSLLQNSVYMRHIVGNQDAKDLNRRIMLLTPPSMEVVVFSMTRKDYERMKTINCILPKLVDNGTIIWV